ncbi:MAG: DUF1284 domain-containing protein [Candidatus Geothermincolales bacterium]
MVMAGEKEFVFSSEMEEDSGNEKPARHTACPLNPQDLGDNTDAEHDISPRGTEKRRGSWRFRPHHLFCTGFLPLENLARGEGFSQTIKLIRDLVRRGEEVEFVLHEGPDRLCESCPDFQDGSCRSPAGDEEKVRKWDKRVLEGLGLAYGQRIKAAEFRELIREKAPLEFCRSRCPWRNVCGNFQRPTI